MTTLQARGVSVNGPGLEHLKGMKALKTLELGETPLTDEALPHIGTMDLFRLVRRVDPAAG